MSAYKFNKWKWKEAATRGVDEDEDIDVYEDLLVRFPRNFEWRTTNLSTLSSLMI